MSIPKFITWITGSQTGEHGESMSYDAIFKGASSAPATCAGRIGGFLPGLRAVENDVDTYFSEVFAGPLF